MVNHLLKSLKMLLVVLVALFIIVGCSSDKKDGKSSSENLKARESVMSKPVTIDLYDFWNSWTLETFMEVEGKYIVNKYPNVSFNIIGNTQGNSPAELVLSNTNVDLYINNDALYPILKNIGVEHDLSDLVKKYNFDWKRINPVIVDSVTKIGEGVPAGIPVRSQALSLYYNKSIFDKFGVDYVTDGMSWDDISDLTKKLSRQDGGVQYHGYGESWFPNQAVFNQLSLSMIDSTTNKAVFNTDAWKGFIQNFARLYQVPGYMPTNDYLVSSAYDLFLKEQTVAMLVTTSSGYPKESRGVIMNWDVVTYPEFKELPGVGPQPQPVFMTIPSTAKNRDAAFLVAEEMTSLEIQMNKFRKGTPSVLANGIVREDFGKEVPDLQGKNTSALVPLKYANTIVPNQFNHFAAGEIAAAFRKVVLGTTDLNTAMREAQENVDKKIDTELGR